jgi:colicin import membrane protein
VTPSHADILDQHDSLRGPFTGALALHVGIAAGLVLYAYVLGHSEQFGDPNAGGAAVGIEAVKSIPLPHSGPENPVAHDSPSQAPPKEANQEKVKREKAPPKEAIALKSKTAKQLRAKVETQPQPKHFKSFDELDPNKMKVQQAPAVSNPLYSDVTGAGRIGAGMDTTLGTRFGAYAQQIRELVARKWHPGDVDASVRSAPQVVASFELMKDGSVSKLAIVQSSGIKALDFSVQRAILEASPLPPFPPGLEAKSTTVTFTFELKR